MAIFGPARDGVEIFLCLRLTHGSEDFTVRKSNYVKKYVKRDLSTVLHEFQKAWRSTQILPAQNGWITTNSAALIKLRKKLQLRADHACFDKRAVAHKGDQ